MTDSLTILILTALSIGFVHTLLGPDHYLPFIAMARAGRWSLNKTVVITLLCGLGHVLSSTALGCLGLGFGIAVLNLKRIESLRGDVAGWLLIAFGLVYFLWGLRAALRNQPHTHWHPHADGTVHEHRHVHQADHLHAHTDSRTSDRPVMPPNTEPDPPTGATEDSQPAGMTPWILFTIFLFGPCEPLIPLLMYPAAEGRLWHVVWVTAAFGLTTLATMTAIVAIAYLGAGALPLARFQRYGHAAAGFAVFACGLAVKAGL